MIVHLLDFTYVGSAHSVDRCDLGYLDDALSTIKSFRITMGYKKLQEVIKE